MPLTKDARHTKFRPIAQYQRPATTKLQTALLLPHTVSNLPASSLLIGGRRRRRVRRYGKRLPQALHDSSHQVLVLPPRAQQVDGGPVRRGRRILPSPPPPVVYPKACTSTAAEIAQAG